MINPPTPMMAGDLPPENHQGEVPPGGMKQGQQEAHLPGAQGNSKLIFLFNFDGKFSSQKMSKSELSRKRFFKNNITAATSIVAAAASQWQIAMLMTIYDLLKNVARKQVLPDLSFLEQLPIYNLPISGYIVKPRYNRLE